MGNNRMIKRLVCLIRGHDWQYYKTIKVVGFFHAWILVKCTRCGKTKEVWI